MLMNRQSLFDGRQAAQYLGVSVKTVRRWAQTGKLQGQKVGPRGDWRFTEHDLLDMQHARRALSSTALVQNGSDKSVQEIHLMCDVQRNTASALKSGTAEASAQRPINERQRLYTLFMQAPASIAVLSGPTLCFEFANPSYRQLLGVDRPIDGQSLLDVAPDIEPALLAIVKKVAFEGERFIANELPILLDWEKNGSPYTKYFNLVYEPTFDEQQRPEGMIAFANEVTEQVKARQKIEETQRKLEVALSASAIATWIWDIASDRLVMDEKFAVFFGVEPGCISQGLPLADSFKAIHPDDRLQVEQLMARSLETGAPYETEYRVIGVAAQMRWVVARGKVNYDKDGKPQSFSGALVDITQRKSTEAALFESEKRLRLATEAANMYTWDVDLLGRTLLHSENAGHIIGFPLPETLAGFWATLHHEDVAKVKQAFAQVGAHGGEFMLECRMVNPFTHEAVWVFSAAVAIMGTSGLPARVVGITQNITSQKQAAEALKQSEEKFRTLANNISQLAWMTDAAGRIFWYNQRWYDYTGTNAQDMERGGWQRLHHPDYVKQTVEKMRACFQSGETWEDTFPLRGRDGTYRWFLSHAVPIRDEYGAIVRWFGTNTDVTEQKQLEQQKDDFIGVASHELKTPVTSLKGYAQILERRFLQDGDARSADLLHKMGVQINKLAGLVEDLLDVTKIENGQMVFHYSTFDLNTLIGEIVEETQHAATRHTIVQNLAQSVALHADRERIGQVLTNLLTNAIKYAPRTETVLVKTQLTAEAIITSVQDFGIGISKEKLPHLFKRFYRVEGESQRTYPGLGLGLYISAECIKRHQGKIWVESQEGQGTTVCFSLALPQVQGEQKADST